MHELRAVTPSRPVLTTRPSRRPNPLLTVLGNPGGADAVQTFSEGGVVELSYFHRFDPESKRPGDIIRTHEFEKGVSMTALEDGRVVLWRPDGRPVWTGKPDREERDT